MLASWFHRWLALLGILLLITLTLLNMIAVAQEVSTGDAAFIPSLATLLILTATSLARLHITGLALPGRSPHPNLKRKATKVKQIDRQWWQLVASPCNHLVYERQRESYLDPKNATSRPPITIYCPYCVRIAPSE